MMPYNFWLAAASWGSYIRGGDLGIFMYGFNESGRVQDENHRARCLDWIENHCMPGANKKDKKQLTSMKNYLMAAKVVEG